MLWTRKYKVVTCKPEKPAESAVSVFLSPRPPKMMAAVTLQWEAMNFSHSSSKQTWPTSSSNEKRWSRRSEESSCLCHSRRVRYCFVWLLEIFSFVKRENVLHHRTIHCWAARRIQRQVYFLKMASKLDAASLCWPVFGAMFNHDMQESKTRQVNIKDISQDTF